MPASSRSPAPAPILEFDGKLFALLGSAEAVTAADEAERIETAPESGPVTFQGLYRPSAMGVHLYKPNGALEAYLVNNHSEGQFIVSAFEDEHGAVRYMNAASSLTEQWLGSGEYKLGHEADLIRRMTIKPSVRQVQVAVMSIDMGNNGYADLGADEQLADAVREAGYTVIATTDLHGKPTFRGFTAAAQAALAPEEFGRSTYGPVVVPLVEEPDYEEAILARDERMREF